MEPIEPTPSKQTIYTIEELQNLCYGAIEAKLSPRWITEPQLVVANPEIPHYGNLFKTMIELEWGNPMCMLVVNNGVTPNE